MSQDHLGNEPLNLALAQPPPCRDLCRFLFEVSGHTNRTQASLYAVAAGMQQRKAMDRASQGT